jgi:RNA polymerase sigma-70 factor (ECF subfamily)
VEFYQFTREYLDRLRARDPATVDHFCAYFEPLLRMLLRARRVAPDLVDDLVQDTFRRVFEKLQNAAIREPNCFGSFVNSICKNALREKSREGLRNDPIEDAHYELPDKVPSALALLEAKEIKELVRSILKKMDKKDSQMLRDLYFLDKDKDEICRERGVDREYLRVLHHRAKIRFRKEYKGK